MHFDQHLTTLLDKYLPDSSFFASSARYALFSGGKRLRPSALFLITQTCAASIHNAIIPAVSLELIHTYSLIHDDLPCMDNDSQRRGKPTLHVAFGEANALMTGNLLLGMAFEILLESPYYRDLAKILSRAIGDRGLLGGQALDLTHSQEIEKLFRWKTGALFGAAFEMGALLGDQPSEVRADFKSLGEEFGILYQISDDFDDQNFITSQNEYFDLMEKSKNECQVLLERLRQCFDLTLLEKWIETYSSRLPSASL